MTAPRTVTARISARLWSGDGRCASRSVSAGGRACYDKLDVSDRAAAVAEGMRRGLIR
jgi:hypothetical protein